MTGRYTVPNLRAKIHNRWELRINKNVMSAGLSSPSVATLHSAATGHDARSRAEAIYAEQVRHLYRLSRLGYAATLLTAAIVVLVLWNVVPATKLVLWAGAVVVVTAASYALYFAFQKRQPPNSEMRRWGMYFISGTAAVGAM